MDNICSIPAWIIENRLNIDVVHFYAEKYGNLDKYKKSFIEIDNNKVFIKSGYLDFVCKVPATDVLISFVVVNDSSVANRRYQESYVCQTPMIYAYDDLFRLFDENIPKIRQRNVTRTYLEPLISYVCAKFLILKALTEATVVNGSKEVTMTITSKSLKIHYSFDNKQIAKEVLNTRKEYFDITRVNTAEVEKEFKEYIKQHRTQYRYSYYDSAMTLEILYNVRKSTFKEYAISLDDNGLLTKSEYDLYNFIKNRGGSTIRLLADEFNFSSTRAVKYHLDKLIKLGLIKRVGVDKSHNCFYRIK